MLFSIVAEILTLASVFPLIAIFIKPQILWEKYQLYNLSSFFMISDLQQLRYLICCLFVVAVLVSGSVRLLNLWLNGRTAATIASDFSCRYLKNILYQPYIVSSF